MATNARPSVQARTSEAVASAHELGFDSGRTTEVYLTVNNLFNERAPLFPSDSGLPNLFYPTLGFHDDMGRFFTLGARIGF